MLINLSNHPSADWSQEQKLKAIELYQEIIDMPFPNVDPNGDEEYIENLTNEYLNKVLEIKNRTSKKLVVHLMGELTFSFALLVKLKANGIKCVASTTKRIVEATSQNTIVKTFVFVRFREYI
jgi:hypothetical protein